MNTTQRLGGMHRRNPSILAVHHGSTLCETVSFAHQKRIDHSETREAEQILGFSENFHQVRWSNVVIAWAASAGVQSLPEYHSTILPSGPMRVVLRECTICAPSGR